MIKFSKYSALAILLVFLIFASPNFASNETVDSAAIGSADGLLSATDIYVNASNDNVGNGSFENPYRNLDNVRIDKDSTVHLSNGNYTYRSFRSLNDVEIIGENADDTVIRCNNLEITSNNLILRNLTIIGGTFKNQGDFTAENVIFKYGRGHDLDEYENSYGGSIYTSYRQDDDAFHTISLTNCYFINNTAEYGGAIYIDAGYMDITDCYFINNSAYNYGGAISVENANKVTIRKSKFINDFSINDCAGAIYVLSSSLTLDGVDIINCSSTFGPAITGLNAKLDINKLHAFGNEAKYDGGAIYQMYGTSLITSSEFICNSAKNGGALCLDNVTALFLISNRFINNSAKISGGALYLLSNREYSNLGNVYENNHAAINDDIYNASMIDPIIRQSDYITFKYVPQGDISLPSYYNLADDGYDSPIKDQMDGGNCWSFAVLAALESCILKSTNTTYDLSEENMKNLMASFSDYGWQIDVNEGGYDDMGIGYLVGWLGPVLESEDLYDDKSALSPVLNSLLHIQNIVYLKRNDYLDNDGIKEAIMKYGGVATGIYYSGLYLLGSSYYYYDTIMPSNHAVTIVGWDDNYSRYNFNHRPAGDGAFIAKNSWGTDFGDNGYFYVSYYDTKFAQVGKDEVSYTFILNDTIRYDKNYQYDISGKTGYLITGENTIWYQNTFSATDDEYLAAVSTYFNAVTDWDVSVYVNDVFKMNKSGNSQPGYYTINLGNLIHLHPGDVFKVIFKLTCDGYANVPIIKSNHINKVPFSNGISYFSKDGENWIDLFNYTFSDFNDRYLSQLACIKAFTIFDILNSTLRLDISDKGIESANIKAIVCDQYGNMIDGGEVIFTIGESQYVVNVTNGLANVVHIFNNKSQNVISALFVSENYNSSFDECSIEFYDAEIVVTAEDIQYGDELVVNITLIDSRGNLLSDDVNVMVCNEIYPVHVNGNAMVSIPVSLSIGKYDVIVRYNDTLGGYSSANVYKANVNLDVVIGEERENLTIDFSFSKPINETVNLRVSGKTYEVLTENGMARLFIDDLDYGTHEIEISFTNQNYGEIHKNYTVQTSVYKSRIMSIELQYGNDLCYVVKLTKLNDSPLCGEKLMFSINNVTYENITDDEGITRFVFNAINGIYPIRVSFGGHGDVAGYALSDNLSVNRKVIEIQDAYCPSQMEVFDDEHLSLVFSDNANGNVEVLIDGEMYLNEHFALNCLDVPLSSLSVGNHEIEVRYNGIEGYVYSNVFAVKVTKANPHVNITSDNLFLGETAIVTFSLSQYAEGYLFVEINGKNYYSPLDKGRAVFKFADLHLGDNLLSYSFDGDDNYLPLSNGTALNVRYIASLRGNKDMTVLYTSASAYRVQVMDANGKAVTGGSVVFNVAGKSYSVGINKSGWASYKINLKPKTYTVTTSYKGIKVSNKIVVKSILKLNNFKLKKSAKKVVIKASLSKINGKYLKGKKITFKFKGIKYVVKTNKKGVAKIVIKKNVIKKLKINKKYIIQVNYLKDTVKKYIKVIK